MAKIELPFEYHIFQESSKSLEFNMSDSLRKEFDAFTNDLTKLVESEKSIDSLCDTFQMKYQLLSKKLIEEMKEKGLDKRATHSFEELRYMFKWGYMLKEAYPDMTLKTLGDLFGMKSSGFAKQGLYPHRAYKYQQIISQNNCYFQNTAAHNIATVINQKIQLPYLTNAQIVVSNDTDVYVDLVQDDSKMFICTCPYQSFHNTDELSQIVYSLARFHFMSANIKYNVSKLKDSIIAILEMNNEILSKNFIVRALRDESVTLNDCVRDRNVSAFLEMRKEYQNGIKRLNMLRSELNARYIDPELGMSENEIREEIKQIEKSVNRWEKELCSNVAGNRYLNKYKTSINIREYLDYVRDYMGMMMDKTNIEKTELDLAAAYFVVQSFGGVEAVDEISYKDFMEVKEDLKSSRLVNYMNRICKYGKEPHIKEIVNSNYILGELESIANEKGYIKNKPVTGQSNEPVLLYIDNDVYDITQEEVEKILKTYQVALVVKTSKTFEGLQILDKNLQLSANLEELQNEYKY